MPNTLTNLIPDMYAALAVVSREQVGFIPAVTLDADVARAAVGQTVRAPVAPAASASDITPGVTPPDDGDANIGNKTITISKARRVPVRFTGEESLGLNTGPGVLTVRAQRFAQAMRTLCNEIEADIAALYKTSSRAYGAAGTTPFATAGDYSDASFVRQILIDNGAPTSDLQLVINTTAGAVFRGKQTQAQQAGSDTMQRQGVLLDVHGMQIRESAQVKNHTKGTGASYLVNNGAGYASGATTIAADTGTGTILAGDVITFNGNNDKHIVGTALSGGSLALNEPGLRSVVADNTAITVGNSYAANLAFSRSAIVLATRTPALPEGGDSASDRFSLTDPMSGLTFEISVYAQYKQVQYEVAICWGAANFNPAHTATLLG
ncbi:P22 phage major capsid protein family protein [Methylomonas sp. ZR1]|uniref:P22 phage major capsid protein family protein n=1 Tax=Methylomonas sp. ZR1 TaxID=1797072 RepID=UPI0014909B97|nr:P22 phage major capsid protein family protein [Methylomonas sp. ZR1]NOV29171.1 P22 coat - protein 5 family protein [Methylomonas sp. ZR1]